MNKKWLSHLKYEEDREAFRTRLKHSHDIFDVLKEILKDKYEHATRDRRSLKSYMTQNWSEFQADRNATERTLLEIIELLPNKED